MLLVFQFEAHDGKPPFCRDSNHCEPVLPLLLCTQRAQAFHSAAYMLAFPCGEVHEITEKYLAFDCTVADTSGNFIKCGEAEVRSACLRPTLDNKIDKSGIAGIRTTVGQAPVNLCPKHAYCIMSASLATSAYNATTPRVLFDR